MSDPHTLMHRVRVLAIALVATLAVVACQGNPSETQTTSVDTASVTAGVTRA